LQVFLDLGIRRVGSPDRNSQFVDKQPPSS